MDSIEGSSPPPFYRYSVSYQENVTHWTVICEGFEGTWDRLVVVKMTSSW